MKYVFQMLLLSLVVNCKGQQVTSGGKLKPEQAIMDVRHYRIALEVNIAEKSISGYTKIDVNMLQATKVLLFDLLDSFDIKKNPGK